MSGIDWVELSKIAPSIVVMLVFAFFVERMSKAHQTALDKLIDLWMKSITETLSQERELRREGTKETVNELKNVYVIIERLVTKVTDHDNRFIAAVDSMKEVVRFLHGTETDKKL